jgi:outer membrane putative beta-barrel porin/alpha-amylase
MRIVPGHCCAIVLAVLGLATAAAAQERPLCADRPGKDTAPCVLDAGRWQVEMGATGSFQRQDGVSTQAWDAGEINVRHGLTPTFELQLVWTPFNMVRTHERAGGTSRATGSDDLVFAVRKNLRNPDGSGTSIAIQPYVSAPTGARGIGAGRWAGGLAAPLSFELDDAVGLSLTPEVDLVPDADGSGSHLAWANVVSISRGFGPVELSAEVWGQVDDDPSGASTQASFDLAAAWTPEPLPDVQFDVGVNLGLTADTPDVEVMAGVAKRF